VAARLSPVAALPRGAARALRAGGGSRRGVDGRRPVQRRVGGGGGIQAIRKARARLTLSVLSALAYAGVLAYASVRESTLAGLVVGIGMLGAMLLALVLWRGMDELLPWALVLVAMAYLVSLLVHGRGVDGAAPLVAVGLLACAELATWSLDERHPVAAEPAVVWARVRALAALLAAGFAASALVVALSAASAGAGL